MVWRALRALLLAAGGIAVATLPVHAQVWTVGVAAGHAQYDGVRTQADGPNALASVGYGHANGSWGYLAGGTPIDGFSLPWAAFGAGTRAATQGQLHVGADLAGHGYLYSMREHDTSGGGGILHLLPLVGYRVGLGGLELYSGVQHHHARGAAGDSSRTALDSGLRISLPQSRGFAVLAEARLLRVEEENHSYAGASASYGEGRLRGWASAGAWLGDTATVPALGIGATVQIRPSISVNLSFRRETSDPLFDNTPRRSWSLGVTHRLGGGGSGTATGVRVQRGKVTLLVPRSESPEGLSVAGEFNGWTPVEMTESGRNWSLALEPEPGVYRYAFRRPDGTWFVPRSGHRRIDDGMGGESAILVVP